MSKKGGGLEGKTVETCETMPSELDRNPYSAVINQKMRVLPLPKQAMQLHRVAQVG